MAIVVESVSTLAYQNGDLVITKPTGLAIGDLMLGIGSGGAGTFGLPSGWTQIDNRFAVITSGGNTRTVGSYKIADSGDVAASNFTFTQNSYMGGAILRISGVDQVTPIATSNSDVIDSTSTTNASFNSTVTPSTANSLIVFMLGDGVNANTTNASSTYAIATDNPTWTERVDQFAYAGGSYNNDTLHMAVATAPRTQTTATGNASATLANAATGLVNIMVVVNPVAASGPANLKSLDTNVKANIKSYNTNVLANIKSINTNT